MHNGVGEVVGEGLLQTDDAVALAVGPEGAIYLVDNILDDGACRVRRFAGRETSELAGGFAEGDSPAQLGGILERLVGTRDGTLYVMDTCNDRVQKWPPGVVVGTTVAGGNGSGSGDEEFDYAISLCVTEDETIYVVDHGNRRIMKWREGCRSGVVVAGGHGGADGLEEPVDITTDSSGALYILDKKANRVVRWPAPSQSEEPASSAT